MHNAPTVLKAEEIFKEENQDLWEHWDEKPRTISAKELQKQDIENFWESWDEDGKESPKPTGIPAKEFFKDDEIAWWDEDESVSIQEPAISAKEFFKEDDSWLDENQEDEEKSSEIINESEKISAKEFFKEDDSWLDDDDKTFESTNEEVISAKEFFKEDNSWLDGDVSETMDAKEVISAKELLKDENNAWWDEIETSDTTNEDIDKDGNEKQYWENNNEEEVISAKEFFKDESESWWEEDETKAISAKEFFKDEVAWWENEEQETEQKAIPAKEFFKEDESWWLNEEQQPEDVSTSLKKSSVDVPFSENINDVMSVNNKPDNFKNEEDTEGYETELSNTEDWEEANESIMSDGSAMFSASESDKGLGNEINDEQPWWFTENMEENKTQNTNIIKAKDLVEDKPWWDEDEEISQLTEETETNDLAASETSEVISAREAFDENSDLEEDLDDDNDLILSNEKLINESELLNTIEENKDEKNYVYDEKITINDIEIQADNELEFDPSVLNDNNIDKIDTASCDSLSANCMKDEAIENRENQVNKETANEELEKVPISATDAKDTKISLNSDLSELVNDEIVNGVFIQENMTKALSITETLQEVPNILETVDFDQDDSESTDHHKLTINKMDDCLARLDASLDKLSNELSDISDQTKSENSNQTLSEKAPPGHKALAIPKGKQSNDQESLKVLKLNVNIPSENIFKSSNESINNDINFLNTINLKLKNDSSQNSVQDIKNENHSDEIRDKNKKFEESFHCTENIISNTLKELTEVSEILNKNDEIIQNIVNQKVSINDNEPSSDDAHEIIDNTTPSLDQKAISNVLSDENQSSVPDPDKSPKIDVNLTTNKDCISSSEDNSPNIFKDTQLEEHLKQLQGHIIQAKILFVQSGTAPNKNNQPPEEIKINDLPSNQTFNNKSNNVSNDVTEDISKNIEDNARPNFESNSEKETCNPPITTQNLKSDNENKTQTPHQTTDNQNVTKEEINHCTKKAELDAEKGTYDETETEKTNKGISKPKNETVEANSGKSSPKLDHRKSLWRCSTYEAMSLNDYDQLACMLSKSKSFPSNWRSSQEWKNALGSLESLGGSKRSLCEEDLYDSTNHKVYDDEIWRSFDSGSNSNLSGNLKTKFSETRISCDNLTKGTQNKSNDNTGLKCDEVSVSCDNLSEASSSQKERCSFKTKDNCTETQISCDSLTSIKSKDNSLKVDFDLKVNNFCDSTKLTNSIPNLQSDSSDNQNSQKSVVTQNHSNENLYEEIATYENVTNNCSETNIAEKPPVVPRRSKEPTRSASDGNKLPEKLKTTNTTTLNEASQVEKYSYDNKRNASSNSNQIVIASPDSTFSEGGSACATSPNSPKNEKVSPFWTRLLFNSSIFVIIQNAAFFYFVLLPLIRFIISFL